MHYYLRVIELTAELYSYENISHLLPKCFQPIVHSQHLVTYVCALCIFKKLKQLTDVTNHFLINKSLQGYRNTKFTRRYQIAYHCWHIRFTGPVLTSRKYKSLHPVTVKGYFSSHVSLLPPSRRDNSQYGRSPAFQRNVTFQHETSCALDGFDLTIRGFKHKNVPEKSACCRDRRPYHVSSLSALVIFTITPNTEWTFVFFYAWFSHIRPILYKTFIHLGYNPDQYKGHNFCIFAATKAAECGLSETKIQQMGRWSSTAFKQYNRIPMLHCWFKAWEETIQGQK